MIYVYVEEKLKEKYKAKIDYSLEFIFSFLGYNYKICDNIKKIKKTDSLIIYSENISIEYCKNMINNGLIANLIYIKAYSEAWESDFASRVDIDEYLFEVDDFLVFSLLNPKMEQYDNSILHFGFDLFSNVFYHLKVNENNFKVSRAFFQLNDAYVNRMILYFERSLIYLSDNTYKIKKINLPFKPQKNVLALCFSIDNLIKWEINNDFFKKFFTNNIYENFISVFKFLFSNKEEYWNFSLLEKFKNTCFLAFSDVNYDLQDEKINSELLKIKNAQGEIAYWLKDKEQVNKDLILDKKIGLKISEIPNDDDLKFEYLYKEQMDNYGITYPYHSYFWENKNEKKFVFTANKFFEEIQEIEDIENLIETYKQENALLILDIYFSSLADNENIKKIVEYLEKKNFALYSLKELNDWIKAKDAIYIEENESEFTITFLEEIKNFAFKIIGNYKVKEILNVEYYLEEKTIIFPRVNYLTQAKVFLEKI